MSIVRVNGYPMDVAISEEHSFPGEVTKRPVEQGADFTDHIRDLPPIIKLECIVSDLPVGDIASDATRTGVALPSADALAKLIELKAARKPVTIETSLGRYESMAFVELTIPRDAKRSGALFFAAAFERVVVVTNRRTRTAVKTTMAGAGGKAGANSKVPKTMVVTPKFEWRHGVPPGKPWKAGNPIEMVTISNGRPGVTKAEVLWISLQGPAASTVTYTDATGTEIKGARRRAFIADIRRDATKQVADARALLDATKTKAADAAKPDPWGKPGSSARRFILTDPPKVETPSGTRVFGETIPDSVIRSAARPSGLPVP